MSDTNSIIRVSFASGTLGCLSLVAFLFAPVVVWIFGFADVTDSTSRSAGFIRLVQSARVAEVPIVALMFGIYFLYEAYINAWRWVDGTAIALTPTRLLLHPTYHKEPIDLPTLVSVKKTFRSSGIVKTINPSLIVEWRPSDADSNRSRWIRNVDLNSANGEAFRQQLDAQGKWSEET